MKKSLYLILFVSVEAFCQLRPTISQSSQEIIFDSETPSIIWNGATSGDYPQLNDVVKVDLFVPTTTNVNTYNHVPMCIEHNDKIHVMYTTSNANEGNPGGYVRYQVSEDGGVTWSVPVTLFDSPDDDTKDIATEDGRHNIPCRFVVVNGELYAVAETDHLTSGVTNRVRTGVGAMARKINDNGSFDTIFWIENVDGTLIAPVSFPTYQGYSFNIPLRTLLRDKMISDFRFQPTRYYSVPDTDPLYTRDGTALIEPFMGKLPNGQYLKIWRVITGFAGVKKAQTSSNAITWNAVFETQIPDAPSATEFLTLSNRTVCLVGNNQSTRTPLFFALSSDGLTYESADIYNIDTETGGPSFSGSGKSNGVQYPAMTELNNGKIFVVYSVNKEGIRCSIFDKPILN